MRLIAQVIQPLKIKRRNVKVDTKQREGTTAAIYLLNTDGGTKFSLPFDTRRNLLSAAVKLRN